MPENNDNLNGIAETLLFTLYIRGIESQRADAILKDRKAEELVKQMEKSFSRIKKMKMAEHDKVSIILRNREFDRLAKDFLSRYPDALVIHIGCGLDARFERVDNGTVEWFDLDVPEVINLRKKLIGAERKRYHLLSFSVFDSEWLNIVHAYRNRPFLFLAEGVFMYFEEGQIKAFVLSITERFPGSELVFDGLSPFVVRANNRKIARTKLSARYHWALQRGKYLESWNSNIHLLEEWRIFDQYEHRLANIRWMRFIPLFAKAIGIFHYKLGKRADKI
jgi:O-methyltransferase involved in polyketide biosynthesis